MTFFEQQVRVRAYHIWEDEGRVLGRAEDHWLRAEAEFVTDVEAGIDAVLQLTVQPSAAATSDVPSPAKVLKPRASRAAGAGARAVTAKADAAALAGATTVKKAAAKTSASKSTASKAVAAKPAAKTKTAKAAPRSNAASSLSLH